MKIDTPALAAVAEDGNLNTSAEFGECWIVRIDYNTQPDGSEVGEDVDYHGIDYPSTFHGSFETQQEAADWLNVRIEDDTDVDEAYVLLMNKVRP